LATLTKSNDIDKIRVQNLMKKSLKMKFSVSPEIPVNGGKSS